MFCVCGGNLEPIHLGRIKLDEVMRKHRPWSKNRRIAKKQRKRFMQTDAVRAAHFVLPLFAMTPFRCAQCNTTEGFYSALGRNLFTIFPIEVGVR